MNIRPTTPALDLALHQGESFARQILESSLDCIKILDLDGRLKYMNAPGMQLLSIQTDADYFDRDWLSFWSSDDQAAAKAAIASAKAGGVGRFQGFCATMSGVPKWWDVVVTPIRDDSGQIQQLLSISRDITEQKQAEIELHRSNAILNSINESTPTLMFVKDRDGRMLVANPAVIEAVGKPPEEILGKTSLEFHEPREEAEKSMENDRLVMESGRFHQFEEQLDSADGRRVFLSTKSPYRDEQGNVIGIIGITNDITDRKRTEAALHTSNARLETLYEISSDLLSSQQPLALIDTVFQKLRSQCDLDVYFNYLVDPTGEKLRLASWSGISEAIALEYQYLELGQAICGKSAQQQCQIVVSDVQNSTDPKTSLIRAVGITAYASQPLIAGGRLLGTLSFASRTRTSFTEAETDLMQALCDQMAIERAELIHSLQQQAEQLREANRLKDEFLAVLSHELRTPLNPILGWTKMLQSRCLDEAKTHQALSTIERNACLQSQLIDDLLDISRIMRGKLSLNPDTLRFGAVVSAAIETVRLAADAKSIALQVALDSAEPAVFGDSTRLQQVVWNLLSNAVKFTPNRGQIKIQLTQTHQHVTLQVSDTGKGIHPDFLPHLFEYFRQQDGSTTRKFGGLGLGLAIARQIVELHGGRIEAASKGEDQGATFTVHLPIAPRSRQADPKPHSEPAIQARLRTASPEKTALIGVSILIVDDDLDTRNFLTFLLQENGATVTPAPSAIAALRLLEVVRPDLILSDIGMPDMNGYTLMQSIRKSGRAIPAIALTAYAGDLDQKQAIESGFQHHLAKPIDPETVIGTIAQLINVPL